MRSQIREGRACRSHRTSDPRAGAGCASTSHTLLPAAPGRPSQEQAPGRGAASERFSVRTAGGGAAPGTARSVGRRRACRGPWRFRTPWIEQRALCCPVPDVAERSLRGAPTPPCLCPDSGPCSSPRTHAPSVRPPGPPSGCIFLPGDVGMETGSQGSSRACHWPHCRTESPPLSSTSALQGLLSP